MAIKQLADGGTEGAVLGQSATDKIGFYGLTTPIARQTTTLAAALATDTTTAANVAAAVAELYDALSALGIVA